MTDKDKVSLEVPFSGRLVHKSWMNCQMRSPSSWTIVDLFIITNRGRTVQRKVYYENYI